MSLLAEAISCLQKASSCEGCGRLPSSASDRSTSGDGDERRRNDTFYGGALLVSRCGDCYCNDCWEESMPNCPICLCETGSSPKPMISSLAANCKVAAFEKLDRTDLSRRSCVSELSSLVGILRNLASTTITQTISGASDNSTFEEEVTGTCLDCYKKQMTSQSGGKSEVAETPTVVVESQLSSSLSLLKSGERYEETQTIPGTNLTPFHANSAGESDERHINRGSNSSNNNAQLNYFIDNIGKFDSPLASSADPKSECELSNDESEVKGTYLSPLKMNIRKKVERLDEDSTWDEEFQTEPWELQLDDFAKIDNSTDKSEPVAKRRCVSTSPNEIIRALSMQQKSEVAPTIASGMPISSTKRQLYIAYDVLDEREFEALSSLHKEGVRVMSGICTVPREGVLCPLPAVLVTHAMEKPRFGFGNGELTRNNVIATCHRTYNYMKAVALGARVVDASWLIDCQTSATLLCCESYNVWSDLESYNSLILSGSKIEGTSIRGLHPFNTVSPLKFDGVVFGFLDTCVTNNPQRPQGVDPLTSSQFSSLVECLGGIVSSDAFTLMHILIGRDCATLDQVVNKLRYCLEGNRDVSSWSIEPFNDDELNSLINIDGTLSNSYGDDYRVPIIRAKWLENSICMNSVQSLKEHCIGVLCFEFDMGTDVRERQTLVC